MSSVVARQTILEQIVLKASYKYDLKLLSNPVRQSTIPRQITLKACLPSFRSFTTTYPLSKKGGKRSEKPLASKNTSGPVPAEGDDPSDFSILETAIATISAKLKDDLSKLRTGGRFNPEVLENLKVELDKETRLRVKLGELAQVVPKGGRTVMVIVGEKSHVKPITSAIQGAPELSLQPQPDPHNAQQLNISIPPPTKASRDQAIAAVAKTGEAACVSVRHARAMMQKKFRSMELGGIVRPDDLHKAHKDMEKVVQSYFKDIKELVDQAKKAMEQS